MTDTRVSQVAVEVTTLNESSAAVGQIAVEVLHSNATTTGGVAVSQIAVEVLYPDSFLSRRPTGAAILLAGI